MTICFSTSYYFVSSNKINTTINETKFNICKVLVFYFSFLNILLT